ncbi:MAG: hypothetical protein AAF916_03700 [Planctomycetota bacterium]
MTDAFLPHLLTVLDAVFAGSASRTYVRYRVQNGNDELFVHAAFLADDAPTSVSRNLSRSMDRRVLSAGDADPRFAEESRVHPAADTHR